MCMKTPKVADPVMPVETAAMKSPDGGAVKNEAQRRVSDNMRARAPTILTSGSGVTDMATTEKKTLLGN